MISEINGLPSARPTPSRGVHSTPETLHSSSRLLGKHPVNPLKSALESCTGARACINGRLTLSPGPRLNSAGYVWCSVFFHKSLIRTLTIRAESFFGIEVNLYFAQQGGFPAESTFPTFVFRFARQRCFPQLVIVSFKFITGHVSDLLGNISNFVLPLKLKFVSELQERAFKVLAGFRRASRRAPVAVASAAVLVS